jgi:hypothetical protein
VTLKRRHIVLPGFAHDVRDGDILDAALGDQILGRPHQRKPRGLAAIDPAVSPGQVGQTHARYPSGAETYTN